MEKFFPGYECSEVRCSCIKGNAEEEETCDYSLDSHACYYPLTSILTVPYAFTANH